MEVWIVPTTIDVRILVKGPLANFNPSMDKSSYPLWSVGWINSSVPKLQHHWKLGMDKQFHPTLYSACDYLSMLRLKVNPCYINGTLNCTCHLFYWTISFSFPAFDGGFPDLIFVSKLALATQGTMVWVIMVLTPDWLNISGASLQQMGSFTWKGKRLGLFWWGGGGDENKFTLSISLSTHSFIHLSICLSVHLYISRQHSFQSMI